jgi:primary-amine oxidase
MTRSTALAIGATVLAILLGATGEARAITCPGGTAAIDETLTTGARWEMCWEQRAQEGITFREVYFTPPGETRRKVFKEAGLAQIHVVYDDGSARRLILSENGLGGASQVDLTAAQCPSGTRLSNGGVHTLCKAQAGRGHAWKFDTVQQQGYWLELFSISHTGSLSWIVRWRFHDSGAIEPAVGASGELVAFGSNPAFGQPVTSSNVIGVGWVTSVYWRLDFDIGSSATDDLVERFDVTPEGDGSTKALTTTVISTEGGEALDPQLKRSWRVRDAVTLNSDGRPISYHLEPLQAGHHYVPTASEAWANHDLAITAYDACERLVAGNSTAGGCGANLADFLTGQNVNGADVVIWYRTTYHHLPRDEDEPYVPTIWQGFVVSPRDWTSDNPLVLP